MASKRKKAAPKGDKYADKAAAARLSNQPRVAVALEDASATMDVPLAQWELDLIEDAYEADSGPQEPKPLSEEEREEDRERELSSEELLLYSIFAPSYLASRNGNRARSTFWDEFAHQHSYDAEREVGAGYEYEEEYSR